MTPPGPSSNRVKPGISSVNVDGLVLHRHAKSSEVEIVCTIYPNDIPGLHNSYNFSVTNLSVVMEMRVFIRDFVPVCGAVQAMNDMHRMHMRVFSSHCAFGD
ncbi:hypothetical protein V9T40_001671 [Parthenolecanium corni]|uniref:Uncharacterized protein n=1 Tax=Parthenolecanium corni TaxID=536013 RepID=A0AAN9TKM8_9HEMI